MAAAMGRAAPTPGVEYTTVRLDNRGVLPSATIEMPTGGIKVMYAHWGWKTVSDYQHILVYPDSRAHYFHPFWGKYRESRVFYPQMAESNILHKKPWTKITGFHPPSFKYTTEDGDYTEYYYDVIRAEYGRRSEELSRRRNDGRVITMTWLVTYIDEDELPPDTKTLQIAFMHSWFPPSYPAQTVIRFPNGLKGTVPPPPITPPPTTPPAARDYLVMTHIESPGTTNTYDFQQVAVLALVDRICDRAYLTISDDQGTTLLYETFDVLGANYSQSNGFTERGYVGYKPLHPADVEADRLGVSESELPKGVVESSVREAFFNPANAVAVRTVPTIDSDANGFGDVDSNSAISLRISGEIIAPLTGVYLIGVYVDDGFVLTFDDFHIIDRWVRQPPSFETTDRFGETMSVNLEAGERYWFNADYFDRGGRRKFKIVWVLPGTSDWVDMPAAYIGINQTMQRHAFLLENIRDDATLTATLVMENDDGNVVQRHAETLTLPDRTPPMIDSIGASLGFTVKPFNHSKLKGDDIIIQADGTPVYAS
jgi:hypothetical protein